MLKEFFTVLGQADAALVSHFNVAQLASQSMAAPAGWLSSAPCGDPDNEVLMLTWRSGSSFCYAKLTELGFSQGRFDEDAQSFVLPDSEGDEIAIQLLANGIPLCPPSRSVFVLIQEGGSSSELYLHSHATMASALEDRCSSDDDGAYRTSPVVEVPASLAGHPQFFAVVRQLLRASGELDYPEV